MTELVHVARKNVDRYSAGEKDFSLCGLRLYPNYNDDDAPMLPNPDYVYHPNMDNPSNKSFIRDFEPPTCDACTLILFAEQAEEKNR